MGNWEGGQQSWNGMIYQKAAAFELYKEKLP